MSARSPSAVGKKRPEPDGGFGSVMDRRKLHHILTSEYRGAQSGRESLTHPAGYAFAGSGEPYNPYFHGGGRSHSDSRSLPAYAYSETPSIEWPLRETHNIAVEARSLAASRKHYFIALDLDECSVVGSDTNDILRTAFTIIDHHKAQGYPQISEARSNVLLHELCELIVNPSMVSAIHAIRRRIGYMPYVFAYTNKGRAGNAFASYRKNWKQLLEQCMKMQRISDDDKAAAKTEYETKWKHHEHDEPRNGFWVFLEGSNGDQNYNYLANTLKEYTMPTIMKIVQNVSPGVLAKLELGIQNEIRKIGCATWGMSKALGLDYNMPVFVSNQQYKNLSGLCPLLGLESIEKLFLFDDKASDHFTKMYAANPDKARAGHWSNPHDIHMIPVNRFDNTSLSPQAKSRIECIFNELDPQGFILRQHETVFREISWATKEWPQPKLLFDCENYVYRMGGSAGIDILSGSGPPLFPWDTSLFTEHGVPAFGRARTFAQFY